MLVNSSFPTNNTFNLYNCLDIREIIFIDVAFTVTKVFLVFPLSILVLHLGHQRWRRQRYFKPMSYSDFFSFQMAVIETISVFGWALLCCGFYTHVMLMVVVGLNVFFIIFPGQTLFHVLTCVDHYLAVVQPITYRALKQSGGIKIRNLSTGCVWLLCGGWCSLTVLYYPELPIFPFLSLLVFSLIVVSFCTISVLCVLIRPGPGHVGKDREGVDQVKRRACYTIMIIMAVLLLLFVGFIVCLGLTATPLVSFRARCVEITSAVWFNLPSSLVSPLLFLHWSQKLTFFRFNTQNIKLVRICTFVLVS